MSLVIGRYEDEGSWARRLTFWGKGLTTDNILKIEPSPYTWTPSEGDSCGTFRVLVGSEKEARELFESKLQEKFEEVGLKVEYRGRVGISTGSLVNIKTERELHKLVRETLKGEALGNIEPKDIKEINYAGEIERLRD